jgi:hypothetical protein
MVGNLSSSPVLLLHRSQGLVPVVRMSQCIKISDHKMSESEKSRSMNFEAL